MAVRFDVATDGYKATTGLPTGAYTMLGWFKIDVDRNAQSAIWAILNVGKTRWCNVYTAVDGTTVGVEDSTNYLSTDFGGFATTVGTWYCLAFSLSGTNGNLYIGTGPGALTKYTAANFATMTTFQEMWFGKDDGTTPFLNGALANVKVYGAELTQAEIQVELSQLAASRTANLLHHHRWQVAELTDYSGNGNTLTVGSTSTVTESGPPIPERAVTVDAVGPSATGAAVGSGAVSWTHTAGAGCSHVFVEVSFGSSGGSPEATATATYGGVPMIRLGTQGSANNVNGGVAIFVLANPPAGASTVVATPGATTTASIGGSVSVFGGGGIRTPAKAFGTLATGSVTVTGTTPGGLVLDVVCHGSSGTVFTATGTDQTMRWSRTLNGSSAAGNAAGSTTPSTGGTTTVSYTLGPADWQGLIAVEVLPAGIVVEDSSTPAAVRSTTSTQTAFVSASFTPPPNSVLVALLSIATTSAQASQPHTLVDSVGGAWAYAGHVDGDTGTAFGMATVWVRHVGPSPGAMTVTATRTGTSSVAAILAVRVLVGAKQDPVGSIRQHFTTGTANAVDTMATSQAGAMVYALCCTGGNTPVYVPTADTVNIDYWSNASIIASVLIGKGSGPSPGPASIIYGWTSAAGSLQVSWLALEILPAVAQAEETTSSTARSLMTAR